MAQSHYLVSAVNCLVEDLFGLLVYFRNYLNYLLQRLLHCLSVPSISTHGSLGSSLRWGVIRLLYLRTMKQSVVTLLTLTTATSTFTVFDSVSVPRQLRQTPLISGSFYPAPFCAHPSFSFLGRGFCAHNSALRIPSFFPVVAAFHFLG